MPTQKYSIIGNVITLHGSDANSQIRPDTSQNYKSRTFIDYIEPCKDARLLRLWKTKIGSFLARYVLKLRDAPHRKYVLATLPAGYALFVHKKGTPGEARHDAYLWGSPNKVFRSPAEFFFHAKWLLEGCPTPTNPTTQSTSTTTTNNSELKPKPDEPADRCLCTYCAGTSQTYISKKYSNYTPSRK